jgi:hypothetical protein
MLQILRQPGESWKIITKLDKFYRVKYFFFMKLWFFVYLFCLKNFWIILHDFYYNTYIYTKRRVDSDNFKVWKNFKSPHITESKWKIYLKFLM